MPGSAVNETTDGVRAGDRPDSRRTPVMVLNFNGWNDTLAGLAEMGHYLDDIWVVDNGSDQDRTPEISAAFPAVRIIRLAKNWGWAGGYNRAIKIAQEEGFEQVYLLNNDAVAQPGAVESAVQALRSTPQAAAIGSVLLEDFGTRVFYDGDWNLSHLPRSPDALHEGLRPARSLHGGGLVVRLAAYADIGPFHEDYFLYHEETDWCLRASKAGWRLYVDAASRVNHEGYGSDLGSNSIYYMARNQYLALSRGIPLRDTPDSKLGIIILEMNLFPQKLRSSDTPSLTASLMACLAASARGDSPGRVG